MMVQVIAPEDITILASIGSGKFGDVYKGMWMGNQVALKRLKSDGGLEAFKSEVEILTELNHPNVTHIFGLYTNQNDEHYMVIEFCSEGSLDHLLSKESESIIYETLVDMIQQVARGMQYLHSRDIIHRDLAARNLLATGSSPNYVVKVSDFGMSRHTEDQYNANPQSAVPVRWSAPETLKSWKFSKKSDVWSFGVTVWEILEYGRVPYGDMNNKEVYEAVPTGHRLEKPQNCPKEFWSIIVECFEEKPDDRPTFKQLVTQFDLVKPQSRSGPEYVSSATLKTTLQGGYSHLSAIEQQSEQQPDDMKDTRNQYLKSTMT